ncbi:hypothetical protein VTK73DRAFT_1481 [Phialemonium thermophilum]|uniref:Uncharacterized protein n=1 Tax=Phialemonium thermophilum TaxID=223376 RepID=A0ABR3VTC5_9PEZI
MPTVSVPGLQPPPPLPFKPGPPSGYTPGDGSTPPPGGPPPSGGNGPNGEEPPPCAGCGTTGCRLFGCGHKCGLFGCDGGCGIGFCGGGCGLEGCGPGCGDGKCGIPHGGGGGLPPPGALPTDGDGDDGDDDDCDEENTADDCVEYVYPTTILGQSTATTQTHCEQTTGCSVTATTTTTTITDSSCPLITALPGMPSGFSLGPDGPTVTVAHLTATFTFDGPLASVWGSVATFDIGTAGVTHSSAPQPTPPSSPQPPQCPMGRPDASDCESILFSMGNAQTPIPGSQACYSGTTNNAEWRWCDYYTSGTCQISLGYQTQFGWPFEKSLPSVAFVHEKAADIFASNANCNSGSQDWVDPDISNLDFLVCLKRTGYNCWVSIPQ